MKLFDWLLGPQKLSAPTNEIKFESISGSLKDQAKVIAIKTMDYIYESCSHEAKKDSIKDFLFDVFCLSNILSEGQEFYRYWSYSDSLCTTTLASYPDYFAPCWEIKCVKQDSRLVVYIKKVN